MLKKKLRTIFNISQWFLTTVLVLVVLLLIFTAFNPIKSFQVLRVMSGSMEPKIKVGSVVFIQKINPEDLKKNDIITYASEENPDMSVTHRLIEIEEKENQTVFKTKGDANNSKDMAEVSPSQIKGKVVFSLPLLGYLSVWIRKPLGFGLLVILPAILIIISEILNIKKTIEKEVEKKYAKQEKHSKSKIVSLLLIFFLLGISLPQAKLTSAYFSDVIVVKDNTFSMADDWTAPPTPLLISPGNNVSLNSKNLIQTWQQVDDDLGGEVYYNYESYSDAALSNLRWTGTFTNSGNGNSLIITKHAEGAPNGHVYWRIRACDQSSNCSDWTPAWHFVVDNSLPNTTLDVNEPNTNDIVLNEILPDPIGDDNAEKPNGEWVELYNKSDSTISVAGWHLTDTTDVHLVPITGDKTNTGGTDITGHGFLVVYIGPTSIDLNNSGDTISLYDNTDSLIDSHTYPATPEGKSIARIPDGGDIWYDPIPTPGKPNKMGSALAWSNLPSFEETREIPQIDFYLEKAKTAAGFEVTNISQYSSLDYQILYDVNGIEKGLGGTIALKNENEISRNGLILGTCSKGVCVYDKGITEIRLNIKLTDKDGKEVSLNKSIKL